MSRAFVRPGRSRDFVYHAGCATPALVAAMANVHASVEQVPVAKGVSVEECADVLAQLRGVGAGTCTESAALGEQFDQDTHIDTFAYDPWNIALWKDRALVDSTRRVSVERDGCGGA